MYLSVEKKKEIFKKHGKSDADTGSAEDKSLYLPTELNILRNILKPIRKIKEPKRL